MQESLIFHSNKSDRQRRCSSSKKKGIKVSLTQYKNSQTHQPNIAMAQDNEPSELPIAKYNHSIGQGVSGQNCHRINFTYKSPVESQFDEARHKRIQNYAQSQITIQSMKIHDQKSDLNGPDKTTFSPSTIFTNVQLKTDQPSKGNYPSNRDIRPAVFDIVEQIASKAYSINQSHQYQNKSLSKDVLLRSEVQQQNESSSVIKQATQKKLWVIPERTLQTSEQLLNSRQKELVISSVLQPHNVHKNNNFEHQMKDQQRGRSQRLRKAEQKLLKIIKICDNGL